MSGKIIPFRVFEGLRHAAATAKKLLHEFTIDDISRNPATVAAAPKVVGVWREQWPCEVTTAPTEQTLLG